ncbi:MAG: 4-alpha-glucanotransferase [Elusimicrobiota bacterium]
MSTKPSLSRRASGVLLHPTSLPGARGGTLGAEALRFVDFLADCGQSWWQMLPVCMPDEIGSPYSSPSSFAGSPALIDTDLLAVEGILKKAELGQAKAKALRAAFGSFPRRAAREDKADFETFRVREAWWLADHALFQALKSAHHGRSWTEWDERLRRREAARLAEARANVADEIGYHEFAQWLFSRQWEGVRRHAAARGVALMGDAPLYVRHDSADCWANQDLFFLDEAGAPTVVAGVPPDYFSADGQLWGNPLYRWERHETTGFAWWIQRLKAWAERFDALRLDHFIGLRRYWEIPAGEKTAIKGRWVNAPGDEMFETVLREVSELEIVAEDLGVATPGVIALRDKFNMPGMRVAQFSFGGEEKDWPANWPKKCVGYTGTHDNNTTRGWWEEDGTANAQRSAAQAEKERRALRRALGREPVLPSWDVLSLVWLSPAHVVIAPMTDLLNIGGEGRMNRPGTTGNNWRWRMDAGMLTTRLAGRLALLTGACGRAPESQ